MAISDLPEFRRRLAELARPGLKKAAALGLEELRKEHAAGIFSAGAESCDGSQKEIARSVRVDDRTLRDYRTNARTVPFFRVIMLPRAGILAVIRELIEFVEKLESEPAAPTGTDDE